jgi:hypothetical protein
MRKAYGVLTALVLVVGMVSVAPSIANAAVNGYNFTVNVNEPTQTIHDNKVTIKATVTGTSNLLARPDYNDAVAEAAMCQTSLSAVTVSGAETGSVATVDSHNYTYNGDGVCSGSSVVEISGLERNKKYTITVTGMKYGANADFDTWASSWPEGTEGNFADGSFSFETIDNTFVAPSEDQAVNSTDLAATGEVKVENGQTVLSGDALAKVDANGREVEVWAFSNPIYVGRFSVDANGVIVGLQDAIRALINSGLLAPGHHNLAFELIDGTIIGHQGIDIAGGTSTPGGSGSPAANTAFGLNAFSAAGLVALLVALSGAGFFGYRRFAARN